MRETFEKLQSYLDKSRALQMALTLLNFDNSTIAPEVKGLLQKIAIVLFYYYNKNGCVYTLRYFRNSSKYISPIALIFAPLCLMYPIRIFSDSFSGIAT